MTQGNGNKLIALFMGAKITDAGIVFADHPASYIKPNNGYSAFDEPDLFYNSRWDWLKPVIDKLFEVISEDGQIFNGLKIFEYGIGVDIETAYAESVIAIKCYTANTSKS